MMDYRSSDGKVCLCAQVDFLHVHEGDRIKEYVRSFPTMRQTQEHIAQTKKPPQSVSIEDTFNTSYPTPFHPTMQDDLVLHALGVKWEGDDRNV